MAIGNYIEQDIMFYDKELLSNVTSYPMNQGHLIRWEPEEGVSGYQVFRVNQGEESILVTLDEGETQFFDAEPAAEPVQDYHVYAVIEGDFILSGADKQGGQDFKVTDNQDAAKQDIINRKRTQQGDWASYPTLGANLELLEGEPNTRKTGTDGISMIREALTKDGRFQDTDLNIRAVPTSIHSIEFYTMLDSRDDDDPIVIQKNIEL